LQGLCDRVSREMKGEPFVLKLADVPIDSWKAFKRYVIPSLIPSADRKGVQCVTLQAVPRSKGREQSRGMETNTAVHHDAEQLSRDWQAALQTLQSPPAPAPTPSSTSRAAPAPEAFFKTFLDPDGPRMFNRNSQTSHAASATTTPPPESAVRPMREEIADMKKDFKAVLSDFLKDLDGILISNFGDPTFRRNDVERDDSIGPEGRRMQEEREPCANVPGAFVEDAAPTGDR
jgi:hypothetical protein